MTKEEANKEIAVQVATAYKALAKAEALAIKHKLEFSFSPAYGMGGRFYGEVEEDDWTDLEEPGWVSSSHDC